ncbi:hypothetical protein EIE49_18540 [Salmonella enterica subsp. enterica serovar Chester]|nr:hypothetical protein [Salmonella enterica]EBX7444718.1 hypothetical protein [Salmonella enterica subsp. enterica serovar Chester]EBK2834776.1 hypothetical protein [Salmonella enterica]ECA0194794.1 hypothetical protein [Salmonella enterica subsp. enterica serovar Chester]ECA7257512.1 hypothetical protein [Salmonella enterica subsp. enterica serovar Chester]
MFPGNVGHSGFPGNVGHSGYQRTSHQHRMKHCFCFIVFVNYITKTGLFARSAMYFLCVL